MVMMIIPVVMTWKPYGAFQEYEEVRTKVVRPGETVMVDGGAVLENV